LDGNLRELGALCAQRPIADRARGCDRGIGAANLRRPDIHAADVRRVFSSNARRTAAAVRACGNIPFRLPLVSEIAGSDAAGIIEELVDNGSVIRLDLRYSHYLTQPDIRDREWLAPTPQAVRRLFAAWAKEDSESEADLPQLRLALDWALSQEDDESLVARLHLDEARSRTDESRRADRRRFSTCSKRCLTRPSSATTAVCWRIARGSRSGYSNPGIARKRRNGSFSKRRAVYQDQMQFNFD